MTEAQGTQLIELVDETKQFLEQAVRLGNTVLYAIFAALVIVVCLSAIKAVRRG